MEKPGCPNWELISGMSWTLMSPTERHILSIVSSFKYFKNAVPGNVLIARIGADVKSGVCGIGSKKG